MPATAFGLPDQRVAWRSAGYAARHDAGPVGRGEMMADGGNPEIDAELVRLPLTKK
jgi:hypothetical protein